MTDENLAKKPAKNLIDKILDDTLSVDQIFFYGILFCIWMGAMWLVEFSTLAGILFLAEKLGGSLDGNPASNLLLQILLIMNFMFIAYIYVFLLYHAIIQIMKRKKTESKVETP